MTTPRSTIPGSVTLRAVLTGAALFGVMGLVLAATTGSTQAETAKGWGSTVEKAKPKAVRKSKAKAKGPRATDLRIKGDLASTTLELDLSQGLTAEIFTLSNPYRMIIDLPDLDFRFSADTTSRSAGLVSGFRYGLFAEGKARVVFDTKGPVRISSAAMMPSKNSGASGTSYSLKVELAKTDAASFGEGTGAAAAPGPLEDDEATVAEDLAKARAKPVKSASHKAIVMIDPGHGGIDPGTSGDNNLAEKDLVLAVGKQLRKALSKTDKFEVAMTRTRDVFVSLDQRLKMSRAAGADLFISLHADAIAEQNFAETVRGATIYTLSERASDEQARLMAEKENASDLIAGLRAGPDQSSDQVRSILIDLLKREISNFSADFSNVLARRLKASVTMSRSPQRSAAFKVLKQTHAPSVLIELGYMSNSRDQKVMMTKAWQTKVASAIAAAVDTYFSKRVAERQ